MPRVSALRTLGTCWIITLTALVAAVTAAAPNFAQDDPARQPPGETPQQRDGRMAWWREARFGMFIHWGLYAVPAGEWNGQTNHAEWIRTTAEIPLAQYDLFRGQFNPVKFDARAWARLAKQAGMKYIVITSKHHDGFCLFDSKPTDFDVMSTPFARDIMRELAEACRAEGLRICWYHSIMDWHHPDYLPRRDWEARDRPAGDADFERFVAYLHAQVTELLTNYGEIGVMWFDGEWESTWTSAHGRALYQLCRRLQPSVIVNNRVDKGREGMAGMTGEGEFAGDFGTPEQEVPATGLPGIDWESCITMNDHWGWNKRDRNWKSSQALIRMLVDIVSKGGNFLLNVGPTAEGEFPPEAIERLREIGEWMAVNGESIHGAAASPFDHLPWGRCTMKRDAQRDVTTLYLHVFNRPDDGRIVVPGVANQRFTARLLAWPSRAIAARREDTDVAIAIPPLPPEQASTVIALEVEGEAIVYRPPVIEFDSPVFVHTLPVRVRQPGPGLEVRYTLDGSDPTIDSPLAGATITLTEQCALKARAFHDGRPASGVVERRFLRMPPLPAIDPEPQRPAPGLRCELYAGEWTSLPVFDDLDPVRIMIAERIALPPGAADEYIARRYRGFIRIARDDVYIFALSSDDGSRLTIGGRYAIDNDGLHGPLEKRGTVPLAAGVHEIVIEHFNRTGGAELRVRMGALGEPLRDIDPASLSHAQGEGER